MTGLSARGQQWQSCEQHQTATVSHTVTTARPAAADACVAVAAWYCQAAVTAELKAALAVSSASQPCQSVREVLVNLQ